MAPIAGAHPMTTDATALRALSHAELFQGLSAAALDAIAALCHAHDYEEGEAVYRSRNFMP